MGPVPSQSVEGFQDSIDDVMLNGLIQKIAGKLLRTFLFLTPCLTLIPT